VSDRDKALAKIIARVAKQERLRLVELAVAAVRKDSTIDRFDKAKIVGVIEGTVKSDRGRPTLRPSQRAEEWRQVPAHQAAGIAVWLEHLWRCRNLVRNQRIAVNGKLVPIHEASARKAIQKCERFFARMKKPFKPPSHADVVKLLRKARATPF
jgi:hypothetical protein